MTKLHSLYLLLGFLTYHGISPSLYSHSVRAEYDSLIAAAGLTGQTISLELIRGMIKDILSPKTIPASKILDMRERLGGKSEADRTRPKPKP